MTDEAIRAIVDDAEEWSPDNDNGPQGALRQLTIGSDVDIAGGVAEDLRARLGDVIFCEGSVWRYAETHWSRIEGHELRLAVHRYDGVQYLTQNNSPQIVRLGKARVDSILTEMGAMLARPNFFDDAPAGINCAVGFIKFAKDGTPSLEPHDPEYRCRHVLKGRWIPNFPIYELMFEGSLLRRLIDGVFGGDADANDKVTALQEIAGAAALGYGTNLRQPRAIILKGETAENGKSQVLDLFRSLLPLDAVASIPAGKMGDERFLPQLIGAHLNAADELSSAVAISSEAFKAIVTGEPVTGRDVYRSPVTFRPMAQHVFCTNTLPSFSGGMDRGVHRRLLVVTFNRVIPRDERIEHIGLRIGEDEADLLLAWAVEGASRLIRQREFTIPPSSKTALGDWLRSADPVLAWVEACAKIVDPQKPEWEKAKIKSADVHTHFKRFAVREGYRENILPAITGFIQRLTANRPTITIKHTNTGNWLTGIEIPGFDPEAESRGFPLDPR